MKTNAFFNGMLISKDKQQKKKRIRSKLVPMLFQHLLNFHMNHTYVLYLVRDVLFIAPSYIGYNDKNGIGECDCCALDVALG